MTDPETIASPQSLIAPPAHVVSFAVEVSGFSPCRSKRGVVLFRGADILGHGYNYKPRGFDCDGSEVCKATCRVEAIHAEQATLLSFGRKAAGADMVHVKSVDGQLVASGGPSCVQCSKLWLAAGVSGFWLYHAEGWRRYEMAEFHRLSLDAALSADPLRGVGPQWMPIETAPKDGSPVKLKWEGTTVEAAGRWCPADKWPKPFSTDDWRDMKGDDVLLMPTHWAPLLPGSTPSPEQDEKS